MKTKSHTIELADFQHWLEEESMTFASSTRERKRLVVTLRGNIQIFVGNVIVWQGQQPYSAVEKYNSITEKYTDPLEGFKI